MTGAVPVLTLDGPSGVGKGTTARRLADALEWHLLDSGALYRLVGLAAQRDSVSTGDHEALARLAGGLDIQFGTGPDGAEQVVLDGWDVTDEIRTEDAGRRASAVARVPEVRDALLSVQHGFRTPPGLVADGRDMGTHVFPDATLKVFLTASSDERARRRHKQLKDKGIDVSLSALSQDIAARDRRDSERAVAPLRPAADAKVLDSSQLTIEQVVETVLQWLDERVGAAGKS